ncbi:MAG: DNA replication/repair protein RecF [Pyramidobacter sp.]|jgi:DNA replication and repair protein RecF
MRIAQTRFRSFRNLENALVSWGNGLNVLKGANGSGKTNVLEALHVLTGWGTFGGARFADTVQWGGQNGAGLVAQLDGERSAVIEVSIQSRASLRLDSRACRWGDLRACVQSLAFLPSDMALLEGAPAVRRRFLDRLCALYFPLYAFKLSEYRKITQTRRYLLSIGHSVKVTQNAMADLASWIWECRHEVVRSLVSKLEVWRDLLPAELSMQLRRGGSAGLDDPLSDFHRACELTAERERAAKTPLVGPHRDDLVLTCDSRPAAASLSRGQRRRSALALILSAASSVEERYRQSPLLLFDEVTSELDDEGRRILISCLERSGWQVFAATAESALPDVHGTMWRLENGRISKEAEV